MPALFQYAIFFLAALLCVSLVLCVRESTDPNEKDKARDKAPAPARPLEAPAAVLQRIEPRGIAGSGRTAEPAFPRTNAPVGPEPAIPLARPSGPEALSGPPVRTPVPSALSPVAGAVLPTRDPGMLGAVTSEPLTPRPLTPETLTAAFPARAPEPPAFEAMPRLGPRLPAAETETRLPPRAVDPAAEDLSARSERDHALDQRNDTLWDLVVHLRDYVEQLRAERHTLREEARQLRMALTEAAEEVRALRASQAAANSNELTVAPAETRPAEPARLGSAPKRLH